MQQFEGDEEVEQDQGAEDDDFSSFQEELVLPSVRPAQEQQAVAAAPAPVTATAAAAAGAAALPVVPQPVTGYLPYFLSYCSVS